MFSVLLVAIFSSVLSLPAPDSEEGFRRSDLFLNEPYFLGIPNVDSKVAETLGPSDTPSITSEQLSLQGRLLVDKIANKENPATSSLWPGRKSKTILQNAGSDVVQAFKENLDSQRQQIESLHFDTETNESNGEVAQCETTCTSFTTLSDKWACILNCATQNKSLLSEASNVLYDGMKKLCPTLGTFYSNFEKLNITTLETLQAVITKIKATVPVSSNIPLRTMLAMLIKEVFSPMTPLRSLLNNFQAKLTGLETTLSLKNNILVGAHPGCSMIDMKIPMQTAISLGLKDASLLDYIMLQGYALFTGLTKYVDEFPTKREFSVLNQGLDMMLGTTCGLYEYGASGNVSNCDQIGGYPVLNMPIPQFMWPDELHVTCQKTREKMLLNKQKETARKKRENSAAAVLGVVVDSKNVAADTEMLKQSPRRRRRSLVVGKRIGL